ncbi:hypothetical protein MUK42_31099 [Musa troglodytarum]|uniref:dUTPase-like domain-containing protein n=1 Tax=Musa troglodytarum TaxID=320322 RepID=A0A9E7JZ29_9LILI|nr:hypothetical protein MUK42_31099 [Musa troglodytarum]
MAAVMGSGNAAIQELSPELRKVDQNGTPRQGEGLLPTHDLPLLKAKKLADKAVLPSRASPLSAGYDLSSAVETKVPTRGKALVPTDLSIAIPDGTYARIGVIDADYRGPLGVVLFNFSDVDFEVKGGDRIAQLIIERIMTPEVVQVDDLDSTARGVGGERGRPAPFRPPPFQRRHEGRRQFPALDLRDPEAPLPLPLLGKGRYKLWVCAAILLLALWSMLTGTVTLKRSIGGANSPSDAPVFDDLDVLEVEEREKVVRHMWDVYVHSRIARLPRFWQEAFEAAYEELAGDHPSSRAAAMSEIARMSMRMANPEPNQDANNGEMEKNRRDGDGKPMPNSSSLKAQS